VGQNVPQGKRKRGSETKGKKAEKKGSKNTGDVTQGKSVVTSEIFRRGNNNQKGGGRNGKRRSRTLRGSFFQAAIRE